jgi:hypothetical protein
MNWTISSSRATSTSGVVFTLTAIHVTNRVTLYNSLITFSGTHSVTSRTCAAELGFTSSRCPVRIELEGFLIGVARTLNALTEFDLSECCMYL